ncbi:hypothetical protein EVAR_57674_1 [Eumeta japonica]|uniref:Uncharacterized protein n=1 Tax=Eumeta variegata TaxID=151549 RepID=A0A4C1YPS1_EUMVA|nr:hypothetical protein EVAR_57674_1 [Eumeta japonica]
MGRISRLDARSPPPPRRPLASGLKRQISVKTNASQIQTNSPAAEGAVCQEICPSLLVRTKICLPFSRSNTERRAGSRRRAPSAPEARTARRGPPARATPSRVIRQPSGGRVTAHFRPTDQIENKSAMAREMN